MTAEQARTFTTQLMSQLLPTNFSVGSRDAIKPNMLTVPELMAKLGLDPSQQSLSAIKQLLDNSTNAAYDKEFQSQKESEAAFVRSLADASQLDSLKDVLGTGIYSGQNKGMLAASVLSTMLGEQSNSVDDLNALIQNRGAIASGRTASLTDNASTALTQQQTMQQAMAALSKDYYANQIQQQTNELEANATYDDTAAGYYAANASTFADLLASLLGEGGSYGGSAYASANSGDGSGDGDGSLSAGVGSVGAGLNLGGAKQGANLSIDPNFTPTNARDAATRNTLGHILGKSPSTLNTNQIQKSGSVTTDANKVGTNNFNNIYVKDLISRIGEPKQPTIQQVGTLTPKPTLPYLAGKPKINGYQELERALSEPLRTAAKARMDATATAAAGAAKGSTSSGPSTTPSSAFNNAYVQDLLSRVGAPTATPTASPIIAAAKNAVSGNAGPVSNSAINNANIAVAQKPNTTFNPVQSSASTLNAALKAASAAAKGSTSIKKPLAPTTAAQARKNAAKK